MLTRLKKEIRILIIENNKIYRTASEILLKKYFTVESAATGQEALSVLKKKAFDIILLSIPYKQKNEDTIKQLVGLKQNPSYSKLKIFGVTNINDTQEWYLQQGIDALYENHVFHDDILQNISTKAA